MLLSRDRKTVEKALTAKGFRLREGDHHYFIFFSDEGKKSLAKTKTSHSHKTISDILLAAMARQCYLSKGEFLNLVDCPLSQAEYQAMLQQSGKL